MRSARYSWRSTSMSIMEQAAAHLLELVVVILQKLGELPVYLSEGIWNASIINEQFRRLLLEAGLDVEFSPSKGETWEGIFMIARGRILEK
jgi:hypothetical protein